MRTQTIVDGKCTAMMLTYDSTTQLVDAAQADSDVTGKRMNGREEFFGKDRPDTIARKARSGDLSIVPESDKLLAQFEEIAPATASTELVGAVDTGALDIGAYCAGAPVMMKRRQEIGSQQAPLVIVADLSSSQMVSTKKLHRRGVALLALVRSLAASRPVTLFSVTCGLPAGAKGGVNACGVIAPIETAPLDLARAAYVLSSSGFTRGFGYGLMAKACSGQHNSIAWPMHDIDTWRKAAAGVFSKALGVADSEVLYLPPVFGDELETRDPVAWLKGMIAQYGRSTDA